MGLVGADGHADQLRRILAEGGISNGRSKRTKQIDLARRDSRETKSY